MAFRYHRRVNLGKGTGLNFGKRGISMSTRTRWGSFGSGGFSLRTGIPGLSYRQRYKKDDFITPLLSVAVFLAAGLVVIGIKLILLILTVFVQGLVLTVTVACKIIWTLTYWLTNGFGVLLISLAKGAEWITYWLANGLEVLLVSLAKGAKWILVSIFAIAVTAYGYIRRTMHKYKTNGIHAASDSIDATALDERSYYVSRSGNQEGPFFFHDIIEATQNGYFSNNDLYWDEQQDEWKPITEIQKAEQSAAPNVYPRHASCWSLRSWQESHHG